MRLHVWGFLLLVLMAGCATQQSPARPPAPPTRIPSTETFTPTVSPTPTTSPTATATPAPTGTPLACWDDGGVLVTDWVPSNLLPDEIPLLIYLPPCYFALPDTYFPTVYLIHGQGFTQDEWVRLGAEDLADEMISSGEARPFLMVMPYVADWGQPTKVPFGKALIDEIIPYVQHGYRASPLPSDRSIGGISRGGSWAIHIAFRYWEMFSAVGSHSGPVFIDDGDLVYPWLKAIPSGSAPRIYLDLATSDYSDIRKSVNWLTQKLDELGIPYEFHEYLGYHSEAHWDDYIGEYLRFYTAGWKP